MATIHSSKTRVLLLSAYDAYSHRLWRERLYNLFPEYAWTTLSLSPRNFSWRLRGNSLLWATQNKEVLEASYDLIIATSMVDLSSLRGFVPSLSSIPTAVYFHENQFAYPHNLDTHVSKNQRNNVEQLLVPLYAAYCADIRIFNSQFNKDSFIEGASALLNQLPDRFPQSLLTTLANAFIAPVPLSHQQPKMSQAELNPNLLELVWNHRWEYDKGPDLLLAIVRNVHKKKLPVRLHVVGEKFRKYPNEFDKIDQLLNEHSQAVSLARGEFGYIENRDSYEDLLARSDVVLSTAWHDFQGLSIQEACLHNCVPLVPDDLVYPEYVPAEFRYDRPVDTAQAAANATSKISNLASQKCQGKLQTKVDLSAFQEDFIKQTYLEIFNRLLSK